MIKQGFCVVLSPLWLSLPPPLYTPSLCTRGIHTDISPQLDLSLSISTASFIESMDQILCQELNMNTRETASKRDVDFVLPGLALLWWRQTIITHYNKTMMGKSSGYCLRAREGHLPRLEDRGGLLRGHVTKAEARRQVDIIYVKWGRGSVRGKSKHKGQVPGTWHFPGNKERQGLGCVFVLYTRTLMDKSELGSDDGERIFWAIAFNLSFILQTMKSIWMV